MDAGERVGQSAVCADAGTSLREGHAGLRARLASDHSFIHSFILQIFIEGLQCAIIHIMYNIGLGAGNMMDK